MNTYPDTWEKTTLDQFGEVVSGGTPDRNNPAYWKGEIPWVTPSEITTSTGKYLYDTREKITRAGLNASSAKLLPVNSLLITSRATLGEIAIAAIPISTNQGFKSIIPNNDTDPVFAYYLIKTLKGEMVRLSSGTTFLEISKGDFSRIIAHRPELLEQTRIAYVLDIIDEAIAWTEEVIAKLKQVRAGMLHDLLSYGLDENGRLRDPIAHPEQFKDSPLGLIPREWHTNSLRQLNDFISYGFTNPMPTTSEGPWMLTAFDIGDGQIKFGGARHTSQNAFDTRLSPKSKPKVGDILVTKDGTLGRVARVDHSAICINQSVAVLHPRQETDANFVLQFLRSPSGQRAMLAEAGGSTIKHIYITKLAEVIVPYPEETERRQITQMLSDSELQIQNEESVLEKLKNLKSGLQDDLLTGRVRVPETIMEGVAEQ